MTSSVTLNTSCPKCASADTQSFQMANKSGTSSGSVVGVGFDMNGDIGVARGFTRHQTEIAKLTAPPSPHYDELNHVALLFICAIVPLGLFIGFSAFDHMGFGGVAGVLSAAALIAYGVHWAKTDLPKARAAYKTAMLKWKHSWICLRCGNTFTVR